jgi:hypothetical protein
MQNHMKRLFQNCGNTKLILTVSTTLVSLGTVQTSALKMEKYIPETSVFTCESTWRHNLENIFITVKNSNLSVNQQEIFWIKLHETSFHAMNDHLSQ